MSEHKVNHTTPASGNVFADLGFDPVESANLKLRSDRDTRPGGCMTLEELNALKAAIANDVLLPEHQALFKHSGGKRITDLIDECIAYREATEIAAAYFEPCDNYSCMHPVCKMVRTARQTLTPPKGEQ